MRNSPGTKATFLVDKGTNPIRSTIPASVTTNPPTIRVFCEYLLASRAAASDEMRMPAVAAVKMTPVDRAVAANRLKEDRDDE